MHLFVENIANHAFNALKETLDDPLVSQVLEYVARDEAKHTAIGVLYLPSLLEKLPPHKTAWLYAKQAKWLTMGVLMVKDGYEDARFLGVDLAAAGQKALKQHYKLRGQMSTTKGLLDVPGFEKVIDMVAKLAKG
jgi:hypothetical protein